MTAVVRAGRFVLAGCLALWLAACGTVNYDQQADQQITAITQEINLQLLTWAHQIDATPSKPAAYDTKFYDKVEADLTTLQIRLEASQDPATQKIVQNLNDLLTQVEQIRQLHMAQKTFNNSAFLRAELDAINAQLSILTTFELSLKPSTASGSPGAKTQSTSTANTQSKANASAPNRQTTAGK